jgi:hypothetical protein
MSKFKCNEKGSLSLSTSGNARVDLFFQTVRKIDEAHLGKLLEASWNEDPLDTLKLCFYNRDCRNGKGERKVFRDSMNWIIKNKGPSHFLANLELVSEYGRWEDLLWFIQKGNEEVSTAVANLFAEQLRKDKEAMKQGKSVSLCAKWAPTENCKHDKLNKAPKVICSALGVNYAVYRKEYLTPLRAHIKIVEAFMCAKEWEKIDYNKVPGVAMNKLKKAFLKNDKERFNEYQEKLKRGDKDTKVNATTVEPHDLVRQYMHNNSSMDTIIEEQWKVIEQRVADLGTLKDCLVISDVSGSMSGTPMEVAIALGLLISSLTREPYKNQIITFSEYPQFHTVKGNTLNERVADVMKMSWGMTTNFQAVFDMILSRAIQNRVPAEEMPRRLFVISDMQFDVAGGADFKTHYQIIQTKFTQAGYPLPQIVFWNVRSSSTQDFTNNATDQNVAMISGFSPSILKAVLNGKDFSPYGVLREAIDDERYKKVKLGE